MCLKTRQNGRVLWGFAGPVGTRATYLGSEFLDSSGGFCHNHVTSMNRI
jgi:hypothetical protein